MLGALIFLPLLAAAAIYFMRDRQGLWFGLVAALADFGLALVVAGGNVVSTASWPWLPSLGIAFDLHASSYSIFLLILTPLLTCCALVSLSTQRLEREAELAGHMLLMLACLQGLFLSNNLGLFYFFFEAMLLPAVVLTARWGGENGRRAATKFFLYTFLGSLPMLLGILMIGSQSSPPDLSFRSLGALPLNVQMVLFWWFFLAFAVKVPLFPLHGWLTDLYGSAPAPVVAVIAGAMSKAGAFGFFRVLLRLFPDATNIYAPFISVVALVSLIYGAACALGAVRLREILAYSSLSHLAMIVLGIFSLNRLGSDGAILQMLAHGVCTGGLFLCVAALETRGLPTQLCELSGLGSSLPTLAALMQAFTLASLGLPGLCSFPGELSILTGVYMAQSEVGLVAVLAVILAAWYLLRFFQGSMQGPANLDAPLRGLSGREIASLTPLLILLFWIGFFPGFWMTMARAFAWS